MQTWLKNHADLKMDLMAKITTAQPSAVYLTDIEAEPHSHECVRLPVAKPHRASLGKCQGICEEAQSAVHYGRS